MSFTVARTLFNEEQKNRFLNEKYPNESTRMTNTSILRNVGRFENEKNKDLCKFSYEEVKELLIGMKKKTAKSLGVAYTIIMQYLDWCSLENHYSSMNVLKLVDKKEDLPKYIHQVAQKNSYITRDQMYNYCDNLYNYVDKAMMALLFECVRGRTEEGHSFEELRNLKKSDLIPELNTVFVARDADEENKPRRRPVTVDPRTMDILLKACLEDTYHKSNGEDTGPLAVLQTKNTPYILRTLDRKIKEFDERISVGSISSRFKNFKQYLNIHFLTPTLIFQSGMLDKCLKKESENGELKSEDFRQLFRDDLELNERGWQGLKEMYEGYKQTESIVPK